MPEHQSTQARWGADYVQAISPYVGGKPIAEVARQFGLEPGRIVKLASNENPLGMSPRAKEAMLAALSDSTRYPDNDGYALKQALATRLGVPAAWITLGHGSSDLLEMAARALLTDADAGMYARYSFIVYTQAVQGVGAQHQVVPDRAFAHDLPAMLAAITPLTKLIFVANPNNPTGTFLSADELHDFLRKVPPHIAVVLDEAYVEYTLPELRYDSMAWVREFPNLIVSRTFSKAYGLAGLRIGYGVAQPALTDVLNRVRSAFNTSTLGQAAALAALDDHDFIEQAYAVNRAGQAQLAEAFDALGLSYIPSQGNFVLVKVGADDGAGARVNLALLRRGVIARPVDNYGLPQWLRISVGTEAENAKCIAALRAHFAES
ncbi:histidinol-phosphate transaminase [Thiomonas bhubaneswarensis]|uniref:Histidinol-phosphate aminotransferase n=1 Tax=Thiomonas bhubaneswarensis TaxID=339866 RepID=A0A0K6HZ70_9BURK|nr:histidinol-phosphate transaminase [Thiomonas bhubaneswarensis]CUA96103.1 histidinol-phosphate aminotransferase [Thiomonas bhubaneswarensis]